MTVFNENAIVIDEMSFQCAAGILKKPVYSMKICL